MSGRSLAVDYGTSFTTAAVVAADGAEEIGLARCRSRLCEEIAATDGARLEVERA